MNKTWLGFGIATLLALAGLPATAMAQAVLQPEPAPRPTPIITYYPAPSTSYYVPPPYLRPTAYSFNGPSSATVSYVAGTTTYYQPGPGGGSRLISSTFITPVFGYQPGYYSGYYVPYYYRP